MSANRDFVDLLQPQIDQGLQLWLEGDALRFKAPQDLMTADLMQVLKANKEHIREWLKAQANDYVNNETDLTQSTLSQKKVVDEFPLASTQGAIWMLYRLAPNSPAYNTAFVATTRALDSQAVYQALQALFIRHPMLRSTFIDTDSGPRQRVWNYVDIPFAEVDASGLTELQLQVELKAEADGAFDLQMQSCLRVKIFKNSPIGHVLVATVHHIGADLWALLIIAQEIKHFYEQASLGEALEVKATEYNYQHHVDWQQHYLLSESGQRAKDYWQRQLQNAPTQITLPVDKTRPPMLAMETALYSESLAQDQYQTVKDFCKSQSITPFVFVQTAFQLLVHHLTDANDFLIGTPTMGRSQLGMDKVVGDFANPVVLRAQLTTKTQLQALYKHVQQTLLHAMEFQDYPFPAVVQDCNPARDTSRTPLFQMMFVWHQGNPDAVLKDGFIQDVLPLSGPRGAPYDVLLAISDLGNQFDFNWTYQHSLYETDTIKYYQGLLLEMIQHMLSAQANDAVSDIIQFLPSDKKRSIVPGVCEDTTARIMSAFPVFKGYDAVTVLQRAEVNSANTGAIEDHKVLKRFFIAANDQQVIEATPYLRQLCDDVVVLPRLPRNAAGHWDLLALAKVPCINQKALQKQWNDIDIVASDWQLIHRHCYLPSFSRFDYQGTGAASSATAGLSVVTQSNVRPDAWAKSQPLVLTGDEPKNLVDALRKTAERYPHKGIYFVAETSTSSQLPKPYSYLQLWQDAQRIAAGIKKLGFKRDTILLLQMSVSAQFFATWWAVLLNGLRPLNVAIPDHYNKKNGVAKKLYNVAHNFDGLVVIADTDKVKVTDNWLQTKPVIDIELLSNNNDEFLPRPAKSQDTAFLQLTSGSTGTPKAIQITHGGILHHVYASATYNDYHPDNLTLNWLPFDHVVPILTFHLKDVVLGINQIQVPTAAVLNEPLLWPELLSRYNVTHSWAPNFAYQRVLDALKSSQVEQRWNLSSLQFLMNAGEQVLPGSVKGFQGALSTYGLKASVVQPAFGMAEACTCMTYNNDSQQLLERHICYGSDETNTANLIDMVAEHRASHHFIDLGGVVPGVEVRITDENNIVVKEGVIGRMQIRGPVITPGYLNNEEANAEAFVGDGWFNSGDLGFLWDGRLTLTGREKEMIVVNGANYYCFEIEHLVADLPDVLPTFVAATAVSDPFDPQQQDVLAIFYVPNGYEETKRIEDNAHHEQLVQLEQTIVARVTEGFSIVPRFVIPVSEQGFYKTTSGKIQRSQFKKQFNEGHYQAQVDAYVQRNQASEQPLQHGLVWQWQSQPLLEFAQVQRDGASQVSVTTSTFSLTLLSENTQNALSEYLADRWCQPKVIELGDFDSLNGDPVTATWQFNRKLSLIETVLAEPVSDQGRHRVDSAITLVAYSDNPLELMLLQPLVETLRQESGVANLGLVLTPRTAAKGLIDYRGIASIGWYEAGRMHRQVLENLYVPLNKRPSNAAKGIKNNGVYLVTGGLGALADPVIRWLVGSFNATVFLSGRANLSDHQRHQAAHSRLARLKTELGEDKIHYLYLPNWQEEELALRIDDALSSLASMSTASAVDINTLDGVFHLAGVMELQSLSQMDQAHWERVLDAKVSGSRAIVSYLQKRVTHSLLVQFGSVNGFFGGQSGAAYSLANAYQAQLTASLNQTYEESVNKGIDNSRGGLVRAWCVHWSFWKQTGMAKTLSDAQLQMAKNKGFLPLNPTVDDVQLQRFLSLPPNNYLMGIDPSNPNIASYVDSYKNVKQRLSVYVDISALDPAPTAVKLQQDVHTHWQALVPQCQSSELDIYISDEPLARTDGDWLDIDTIVTSSQVQLDLLLPENELEMQVAMVWQQVLDRDIENVERTFFEYGGHSINATQVVAMLNQRMGSQLTVANLFQYPSVRELAKLLAGSASQTSGMLSLAVADCLERARDYRLDQITKGDAANPALIFLPTASGISSVYWGMISSLKGYDCYAASLPVFSSPNESTAQADDSFTATRLADQAKPIAALIKEKVSSGQRCVLLGWSFAGVLAAELAALLQGYFKQTPDLIMMDSGFSRGLHEITFDTDFQLLMFAVELGLDIQDYAEFNQQLGKAAKLTWLQQRLAYLNQLFTANELNNYWARYAARLAALLNQSEPLIESLHTHQLVAALHSHGREDLGWEYSKSKINWHSIDADHQGIVKHPATIAWVVNYLRELKGR